jgi:hypothetical protein
VSQIERASESQATPTLIPTPSASQTKTALNGAKVQKMQTASNTSGTKTQGRQLQNNGVDASMIKNSHRFHDNANDSTQTHATTKWASTVQGSE